LLLTGFEPFGSEVVNPSIRVAQALQGRRIGGVQVVAVQLPCVFGRALEVLTAALDHSAPQLVLALGQAGGRVDLSLERVAINVDDARMADNAGAQPIDEPVQRDGPAAYFSTLPIKAMVAAVRAAGLPASISQSAGTFVCNHVFYGLMHRLQSRPGVRGGFMHLPLLSEQAARRGGMASLPLDAMVDGVQVALKAAIATKVDPRLGGGAEH
jgi:pyroglutamyl-peptidase